MHFFSLKLVEFSASRHELKILGADKATGSTKLTTMTVPYALSIQFLVHANYNNKNNVETLGILFGLQEENIYRITHCLLPKQTGTPKTCQTTDETQILEFQREYQYNGISV